MTTINMQNFMENQVDNVNANTVKPIIERKRTSEDKSADIGELKGILAAAKASGLRKTIINVPVRLLAIDTSYQTPNRTERDLRNLVNNWVDYKCQPLMGVPHFEDGWMVVMDGYGRTVASQMVDSKKYVELMVMVSLDAPEDPRERQKFEAEMYVYQNRDVAKMTPIQKHGGLEVLEDPTVELLNDLKEKYCFDYTRQKGTRECGILGSYAQIFKFCKLYGRECMEWIFDICRDSGFDRKENGYASYLISALKDIYKLYELDRNKVKYFLSHEFRATSPSFIKYKAVVKYPLLSGATAVSLYIEDLIVENLKLKQSRKYKLGRVVPVSMLA